MFSYFLASIFGEMNYLIVELLIAFAISMVFKQLSEIAEMLGAGKIEQLIVLTVGIIYFPFLLYSTMVYGNIFGIAFALTAIKYEFIFFKFGKKKDAIKCSIAIALGVLMKSNMQIYFLAILFSSAINLIKKWKKAIFLIIAICLTYYIQATGVAILIKLMTGCQLDCPITSFAWIAMGLQNGDLAPGWWNSYTINSYYECGGDVKLHTAMCKQSIESSLAAFFNDPSSATDFFTKKILSTWTNPTFQCFGTVRNGSYIITPKWIQYLLSYPGQYSVSKYLNSFCFLIYFGGFLYIISRNFNDLDELILPMIFIGGFGFYLFWETKSRYALMFFVVLIPCAIRGYVQAIKSLENISINNLKKALLPKKLRMLCVILVMSGFYMIYSNKFNYLLNQDTTVYKEYVENSSKQEITEYIEKQQ